MNQDANPPKAADLYRLLAKLAHDMADDCEDLDLLRAYTQIAATCLRRAADYETSPASEGVAGG